MRLSLLMLIACCSTKVSFAWQTSQQDSAAKLDEVVVTAFYGNAKWESLPAAIATINREGLQKISPVTLVSSFNTIPGVRMEERSPASYRLSFRGSLLRSPFGVRNIKVYWNDFPLTDGGGNTYLNLLSVQQLSGAELLKGPAASVYGAGTGGALCCAQLILSVCSRHIILKQGCWAGRTDCCNNKQDGNTVTRPFILHCNKYIHNRMVTASSRPCAGMDCNGTVLFLSNNNN
jgi:TonB-dependent Receptor Plug Domain